MKSALQATHWSFKVFERENVTYHIGNDLPHYVPNTVNIVYTLANFQYLNDSQYRDSFLSNVLGLKAPPSPSLLFHHANIAKLDWRYTGKTVHQHYKGWNYIISNLRSNFIQNDNGTVFIDFFDNDIASPQIQTALSTRSWLAFVHRAPGKMCIRDRFYSSGQILS